MALALFAMTAVLVARLGMVLSVGMCAPTCTLPPYRVFLVAARLEGRIGIGSNSSRRRSTTTSWRDRQWDWEGAVALACAVVAAAAAALADAGYAAAGASSSSSTGSTTGGSRGCHSKRGQGQERFFLWLLVGVCSYLWHCSYKSCAYAYEHTQISKKVTFSNFGG